MALNAENAKIIREAIIKFGRGIKKDIATDSPFNKTKNGRIVEVTPTGYTVEIENKRYPTIQAINTNRLYLNDIVVCCLPNNQMSQMYIIGKLVSRVEVSGGSGSGNVDDVQINGVSIVSNKIANILVDSTVTSGSGKLITSGAVYNAISNLPIPTVNNGTLTIQKNGTQVATFTANQSGDTTANIAVPVINVATGSESVTDGSDVLNIVTRDTEQTISAKKTFTKSIVADVGSQSNANNENGLVLLNSSNKKSKISTNTNGDLGLYAYGNFFIRPSTGSSNAYGLKMTSSDFSPTTNKSMSLGTSSYQYNNIYSNAIYQNGKQVANAEDIPTVNNATLTIQQNGTTVQTFTANQSTSVTANILVPTQTSELTNNGNGGTNPSPFATESFVNSSVATNTAYFCGTYNIVTDLGLTTSATEAQIAGALATKMQQESITPTNNDYCFVSYPDATDPTQIEKYDRYKYSSSNSVWGYEYTLNNSSFTAAQWAAINSGISAGNYVTTVNGNSGAITVPVASLNTTTGNESVTVDSNTINVVTRDTEQTISGVKTFTRDVTVSGALVGVGGYGYRTLHPTYTRGNTPSLVPIPLGSYVGMDKDGKGLYGIGSTIGTSGINNTQIYSRQAKTSGGDEYTTARINLAASANDSYIETNTRLLPDTTNSYDLGETAKAWRNLYLSGGLRDGNNTDYGAVLPDTTSWTANRTIATADDLSGYLPLSGGTMTGVINTVTNAPAINLRANHNNYNGIISYRTSGNEAVCFDVKNPVTSFIFRTNDGSGATSEWNQVTPSMQIKNQRVAINKLITNGSDANYNLEVNGSVGATTYTIGNAATMQYNSTNESIEFIFS